MKFHPACTHKVSYTYEQAQRVIQRRKRARKARDKVNAYRCPSCQKWHLGHQPEGFREMRRESGKGK